ncbi:protein translocase subunit secG [Desulfonispora thiosulfatigenes DSM 11270]|uniref:Protein-export membrane protein SecG n=1 Tax=Desulfonispora thiosulfatigenes DSM 11270 TaxID=656914 RepID=A0A1W1UW14_DESTI|nr:preprotein translocase subunit SecG [Desulfonispora thiosulfatigenes]SMB85355.1 protein translocase subunit secG [Desulfonispora thiosulfatigenes DSM 11270]
MHTFLLILQILSSIGVIATVLLQSGKSAGLSGAISGGAETFMGKKKGLDGLLSKLSTIFAISFMVFTLIITLLQ